MATKPLVVMIVYFGELPVWLPLTLQSMFANSRVDFVVITDAAAPAILPPNVHFERISFGAMQLRLSELLTPGNVSSVKYDDTFAGHYAKGNDIKPLAAELYPHLVAGHEWWAWSDLDVVYGDLLRWMDRATRTEHAACCRCIPRAADAKKARGARRARMACSASSSTSYLQAKGSGGGCCQIPLTRNKKTNELEVKNVNMVNVYTHKHFCPCESGEKVNVVCPLYPNPWRKKAWGAFTAFRLGWGTSLFRESPNWTGVIASGDYAHFDEWWGQFHYDRGWETMGDVLTRLAEIKGGAVLSRLKMPFAEAKTCTDYASGCSFCPCGAMRMQLQGSTLIVNEQEVMLLHLAQSKFSWGHARKGSLQMPTWAPPPNGNGAEGSSSDDGGAAMWARGCYEVDHLGVLNATCRVCSSRAPTFSDWDVPGAVTKATRLRRHRVQSDFRGHILYADREEDVRLRAGPCSSAS